MKKNKEVVSNEMKTKKKKKKGKLIKIGIPVLVVIGVVAFVVVQKTQGSAAIPVYTSAITAGAVSSELSTSGSVVADEVQTLFAPANVKIEGVQVEKGDAVKAGDMLICFDADTVAYAQKQSQLESAITSANYSANVNDYNEQKAKLAQAEADIANYEAQIDTYEEYIKQLTDGISDETAQKRANLYAKIESVQKQIATYELAIQTPTADTNITELMGKETEKKNELTKLQNELSMLSDYKTTDNWEDKLTDAKKILTDLQTNLSEAKAKKSSADAALVNQSKLSEYQLTKEKTELATDDTEKKYAQAMNGIVAEFSGVITELDAVEGASTQEGTKLAVLERNDKVSVTFKASKFDLESLAIGQKAVITISGREYEGVVSKINHMAEPGNNSGVPMVGAKIEITNPDDKIVLGIEAKVKITTASAEDVLLAPIEAVNEDIDGYFCYVIENNILVKKPVTVGVMSDTYVEIKEGLQAGDVIATMSLTGADMYDGMVVQPMEQ